jgi:hypothetical protein
MKVSALVVLDGTSLRIFFVVVKRFGKVKMKLRGQQQANDGGVQPYPNPRFIPSSHSMFIP